MPRPTKEVRKSSPPCSPLEPTVTKPVKESKVKELKTKETFNQTARPPRPSHKSSKKRRVDLQFDETQAGSASVPASPSTSTLPIFASLSAPADESEDEFDYWKPSDDQLLMQAVLQTKDLELVHKGTKFSYPFSLEQLTSRWKTLLYSTDGSSEIICEGIAELHPSTIEYLERKCPFSEEEEAILSNISSYDDPKMFQSILDANKDVFHTRRSAKSLLKHWQLMKQYYLLDDQRLPAALEKHIFLNFSDVEDEYNDAEMESSSRRRDFDLDNELRQLQRSARKEMKRLEAELPLWHAMSADAKDDCKKKVVPDVDNQTLAVLRGRSVRYLMRSKEISLGRSSREIKVDIDFSLEGYAYKVSRRQAIIKLRNNGEFVFANEGKRPVYVDGNPVLTGNKLRLNHNSVVELAGLRFVFLVNQKLINSGLANHIQ